MPDTVPQNPILGPPLTPAMFEILLALAAGPRHGYAILKEVESRGGISLGPGTLYGAIKRLLRAGLIAEAEHRPDPALDDQRRRYYCLTESGRGAALTEAGRLELLVRQARARLLSPRPSGMQAGR